MNAWQKFKDIALLVLALLLLPVLLVLAAPGGLIRWMVRGQRGGVDETGGDHEDAGRAVEATGEAIENAIGSVEGSRSSNEQSLSLNSEATDILNRIRERKRNQTGG